MEYKHLLKHISHIISDHHWSHLPKNSRCRPPTGKGWGLTLPVAKITNVWTYNSGTWILKNPLLFFSPFPFTKKGTTSSFHKKGGSHPSIEEIDPNHNNNHFPTGIRSNAPYEQLTGTRLWPALRWLKTKTAAPSPKMAASACVFPWWKNWFQKVGFPPSKGSWSIPVRMLMDTTASNFELHRNERLTLSWALGSTKDKLCEKDHRRPTRYSVHLIPIQTSQINLITKTDYRASYGMYISASMGIYTRWRLFNLFRWYG